MMKSEGVEMSELWMMKRKEEGKVVIVDRLQGEGGRGGKGRECGVGYCYFVRFLGILERGGRGRGRLSFLVGGGGGGKGRRRGEEKGKKEQRSKR